MSHPHVLEIVIFKVKPEAIDKINALPTELQTVLQGFDGFIEFNGYSPINDTTFADVVKWHNLESAQAVAQAFQQGDARFLPYMSSIESLIFMGHFSSTSSL